MAGSRRIYSFCVYTLAYCLCLSSGSDSIKPQDSNFAANIKNHFIKHVYFRYVVISKKSLEIFFFLSKKYHISTRRQSDVVATSAGSLRHQIGVGRFLLLFATAVKSKYGIRWVKCFKTLTSKS